MKRVYFLVCSLLSLSAAAQVNLPDTVYKRVEMGLTECVAFAQEYSPLLLTVPQRLESLQLDYNSSRQAFLPNLNAQVGQNFSFGRSQGRDLGIKDTSSANTSFSVGTDLPLFNGGQRWYQLQKAKEARNNAGYIVADVEDRIALQVTASYIQLLLAKQLAIAARDNMALTEKSLEQLKQQVEVGRATPAQLIDIESQLGRDRLSVTEADADVVRSLRILMLDMGLDPEKVSNGELDVAEISPEKVIAGLELTRPHEVDTAWVIPATALLEKELKLSEYDVKIAKGALWPSLSLTGGYSNGYYYTYGEEFKALNAPFKDQLKDNGRYFVGLSLNIPIFNRGQVRRQVQMAQLQMMNLRSQLIQTRFNDDRNVVLAQTDLEKAEAQYRVAKENVALSTQAMEVADLQFKAGRINIYEWEQVKNRHLQAQASYLQSVYMRLLRTINLTYFNTGEIPTHLAEGTL
ncbi:MAG: TolC family protein [Porphyromonas sp.]|nr:TolC family protein [Porphyromonas sp.]